MNENKRTKNVKQNKAINNMGNSNSFDALNDETSKRKSNNTPKNK